MSGAAGRQFCVLQDCWLSHLTQLMSCSTHNFNDSYQSFDMNQPRNIRDHSEGRPMQPFTILKQRACDSNYASSAAAYQIVITETDNTRVRPPSHNLTYRPLLGTLSRTPRSRVAAGQSRQRSIDESNISHTLQDVSDTGSTSGKIIRVNCLKTVPKPNLSIGKQPKLKENADPQYFHGLLHQKQSIQAECRRLHEQLHKASQQNKSLQNSMATLKSQHSQLREELATAKKHLASSSNEIGRLNRSVQEIQQENSSLKAELSETKKMLPDLLKRFDKLERLNGELEKEIKQNNEEWQKIR